MANKIPLVIADFETSLSGAISAGATTLTLASATDDDGNALAAGKYCFTVNNGSSNKQYLFGQLNGTTVTSVVYVDRRGNETSGAQYAARAGAPVIISDFATIQRVADILRGQETLDGDNPVAYDAEPSLSDRKELATVAYVLDNVAGGTVSFDNQIISSSDATAGETISAGNLVFFQTSDQEWYQADADTAAEVEGVAMGFALGSGTDGVSITGGVQISGVYSTTGLTAGDTYYASNTAGSITNSAGTNKRVIGVALSTTKLLLTPITPDTITSSQKDALAGDGGTPSSTNPYTLKSRTKTAGATINGATLPVPVYQNKTDNEFYACDANDTGALKFLGFAISNGTDGNDIEVQFTGIVSGFTGLSEGEKYYVQDTAGTIGTSPGTYEVLVGVAISETELVIQKGRRHASGVGSFSATGTNAITCGFRPSKITMVCGISSVDPVRSTGTWVNGTYACQYVRDLNGASSINATNTTSYMNIIETDSGGGEYHRATITSVTDTGFTITNTKTNSPLGYSYYWEAEGEL